MGKVIMSGIVPKLTKPVNLPAGYTRLEYIESSGTQYIDTGFMPNQDSRVVMDFDTVSAGTEFWFGARTGNTSATFSFCNLSATSVRSDFGTKQQSLTVDTIETRTVVDKNKNVCTVGEGTITNTAATFQCAYTLHLLAANTAGTAKSMASGKLYACQVYDNDVMVRDLVPCLSDADGVGLYDLVNGVFYGNAGTGTFIGSEVA